MTAAAGRLTTIQVLAFVLPNMLNGVLLFPAVSLLPGFYAQHAGVTLPFIGSVLLVGRVLDAVIDPVIGYLSDRTRTRFGARKPWILGAGLVGIVPTYLLFNPGPSPGPATVALTFLAIFVILGAIQIPLFAWSAEITHNDADRIRINAYLGQSVQLGILLMAAAPRLIGTSAGGYTPDVVSTMGLAISLFLPAAAVLAVALAPSGAAASRERPDIRALFAAVAHNRPMWIFLAGYTVAGLGAGINYGLFYLFADRYLGVGSAYSNYLLIGTMVTILVIPFWRGLAARVTKHRALAIGLAGAALSSLAMMALSPGAGSVPAFIALAVVHSIATGALQVAPGALMADIVDYDLAIGGVNRAGSYFAFTAFVAKVNGAIGGGLGLILVGWFGFDPKGQNGPAAVAALLAICFVLPAVLMLFGAAVLWRFPLDTRRLAIIRRKIVRRQGTGIASVAEIA